VEGAPDDAADRAYARYALGVLIVVYVFNFLDRQIISILAERIKADLGLRDDHIGFLYGTAFAVFYALFGLPLGRLTDVWSRTRLIAWGLAVWSFMTAASAGARSFGQLAAARIGVGIGEASASPAAYSLLSDWFPPARRASVLALYSSGIYIGAGLGLGIGGLIVDRWEDAFPIDAPFGLRGWQVAYLAVGLPGMLLALWVRTLREPLRGQSEGQHEALPAAPSDVDPWRVLATELSAVLPPLTVLHLVRRGAGTVQLGANLAVAALMVLAGVGMTRLLGSPAQWTALGIGIYAAFSWAQAMRLRDRAAFDTIFGSPTLRVGAIGFALLAFTGYGLGFWVAPFFLREHGVGEAEAGLLLGGSAAVTGWLGVTLGGVWSDRWRKTRPAARLYVGVCTALVPLPLVVWMVTTEHTWLAFALNVPLGVLASMWIGPGASTVQDLVPPQLRGLASASYLVVVTFVGLALGPYAIGRLSVALDDLRSAMLMVVGVNVVAALLLLRAASTLPADEARRRAG
jgi:MFS family permease